jgi:hypothetical protein
MSSVAAAGLSAAGPRRREAGSGLSRRRLTLAVVAADARVTVYRVTSPSRDSCPGGWG